ncbi:MAG: hypothetical protein ACOYOV_05115 [Bacteroidales bacterium]
MFTLDTTYLTLTASKIDLDINLFVSLDRHYADCKKYIDFKYTNTDSLIAKKRIYIKEDALSGDFSFIIPNPISISQIIFFQIIAFNEDLSLFFKSETVEMGNNDEIDILSIIEIDILSITEAIIEMTKEINSNFFVQGEYEDNKKALEGGLSINNYYHTGGIVKIVI